MPIDESIGLFVANLINIVKSESIEWQKQHQVEMIELKREKEIANAELRHEIEVRETRFKEYQVRVQMEERYKTKEFGDFLNSIDETKEQMLLHFKGMPKPIALIIHHHATELLTQAWHNPDYRERLNQQKKFTQFMLTISEDVEGSRIKALPEKTLELINHE